MTKEVLIHLYDINVLNANKDKNFSWNFISPKDFVNACPQLNNWFKEQNLLLRDIAVTITRSKEGLEKHRDAPPVVAKINVPILNTQNTYNLWWDDNDNIIARHEMLTPIAFNASLNHAVEIADSATFPRIVLSCMFFKEPLHLLNSK